MYLKHLRIGCVVVVIPVVDACRGVVGTVEVVGAVHVHFCERVQVALTVRILLLEGLHEVVVVDIGAVDELELVDLLAHPQEVQVVQVTFGQPIFVLHLFHSSILLDGRGRVDFVLDYVVVELIFARISIVRPRICLDVVEFYFGL